MSIGSEAPGTSARTPTVICTRERTGQLERLIAAAGFDPVHIPLIEIADVDDDRPLQRALASLTDYDWLVVTSRHGAARVGAAAASQPMVRLAAVGRTTAEVLAQLSQRSVDLVPADQSAAGLADAFPPAGAGERVLLAQADRADPALADRLAAIGYHVDAVDAYRTVTRVPSPSQMHDVMSAAAVTFASGSAAQGWVAAFGSRTPPIAVAIGPATAATATESGLEITHIAADHSISGLAATVVAALSGAGTRPLDPKPSNLND